MDTAGTTLCTCFSSWCGTEPKPPCALHHGGPIRFTVADDSLYYRCSPPRLSDEDVQRIADEVIRRLRDGAA